MLLIPMGIAHFHRSKLVNVRIFFKLKFLMSENENAHKTFRKLMNFNNYLIINNSIIKIE